MNSSRCGLNVFALICFNLISFSPSQFAESAPLIKSAPNGQELLSRLPLVFEANEGQFERDVKFFSRGSGYALVLTPNDVILSLTRPSELSDPNEDGEYPDSTLEPRRGAPALRTERIHMKLIGGALNPNVSGKDPRSSESHYFIGNDPTGWRTNVRHFGQVQFSEVYPGVDLVFYGNHGQLEFDFVIAPGADPSSILLSFEGADTLRRDEDGSIVLNSGQAQVILRKPNVLQVIEGKRTLIEGDYECVGANTLRFGLGRFDRTRALVIDPVLSFSSYVGGDTAGVAVDDSGNVYVAGSTSRMDLLTTPGVLQTQKSSNDVDVFVMKFNPATATIAYATYLGGNASDLATGIAIDFQGNAIVSGSTRSSNFPSVNAVQGQLGGPVDAFIAKLNPTGSGLIYSTYLGGKPRFEMDPLSIDFGQVVLGQTKDATITIRNTGTIPFSVCAGTGGGAVTFVGTTASCLTGSENQFVNFSAKITVPALSQTSFTVRFDPARFLGQGHDSGSISFHNGDQSIFAEVPWKGEGIREGAPPNPPPVPSDKTFLNIPPFSYVSGDAEDYAFAVAVDPSGNAYLAGETFSVNFPRTSSAQPFAGSADAFVTKFSPEGGMLFSTSVGGNSSDSAAAIAADRDGNSYIAGSTSSTNFPSTAALQPFPTGGGFVAKLSSTGSSVYSTLLGVTSIRGIAIDESGAVYITGRGGAVGLPTPGAFQTDFGGGQDAFAAKLNPNGSSLAYFTRLGGSGDDEGRAIAVDAAGSAYVTGNTQSPDFPLKDPVQSTYGGGDFDFFTKGDAFLTQLAPNASSAIFSTYLGGPRGDAGTAIALDKSGNVIVGGSTAGDFTLTDALAGWSNPTGGFVAMFNNGGQPALEIQVWQMMEVPRPAGATAGPASITAPSSAGSFRVRFSRNAGGVRIEADAEIIEITSTAIRFRVPVDLLGPSDVPVPPLGVDPNVTLEVFSVPDGRLLVQRVGLALRFPQPLMVDELDVRLDPAAIRTVLHFVLGAPSPINHTFVFLGRGGDGGAGLRVLNTALRFPQPLRFESDDVVVFEPNPASGRFRKIGTPFHIPNLGPGNQGLQFSVSQNGMHVIALEASTNSPGPFPARYQIHLAANVGLPQKLINGVPEQPRGTRLDTLFNHPAPRTQGLFPGDIGVARSALFKFANVAGISQFAQAVLIPPPGGFTAGMPIVRAADPTRPLGITTPTARTPESATPVIGSVIDFTQLPVPEIPPPSPSLSETIGAVLGANDGNAVTLPKTFTNGVTVSELILDMGSGNEIVDGTGTDLQVLASAGSYRLRFGNTPYADSFSAELGPFSGVQEIDLAATGLSSARFVWFIPAPSVVLDAVRALNVFADEISPTLGAITHVKAATMTVRRAKLGSNLLDPFLQLIAPNGDLFGENDAGFGDDLSSDLSDAALLNLSLPQDGFYRYLVKGYDKQPDNQSAGTFFTRLETAGNYDPVELAVSNASEDQTAAQKTGMISSTRQRDSFLFTSAPGTTLSMVINSKNASPDFDPMVELYDPEDFLIGANDNRPGASGKNAAVLNLRLPVTTQSGGTAPNPSTYRIVVSAVDGIGAPTALTIGKAYVRQPRNGGYELKVFTGAPAGGTPKPRIDVVSPASGTLGTRVTLTGANFRAAASENIVRFGNTAATVSSATTTQIITTVPTNVPPGALAVTVTVADQTSAAASFIVISQPATSEPRTASARFYSESIRLRRATAAANGDTYTLDVTSLGGDAPPNGELFPTFDPTSSSHTGDFILNGTPLSVGFRGTVFLQAPIVDDKNRNAIPDFYEVDLALNATTAGDYTSDFDEGTIQATWSRSANSSTGTCRLLLASDLLGKLPEFAAAFELSEYRGILRYTPAANHVNGAVELAQTGVSANRLKGPFTFDKEPTDPLNALSFGQGKLTNAINQALSYLPGFLDRVSATSSNYVASISLDDGDLSTPDADYLDWVLVISDANDADGNLVPDLSDAPSTPAEPLQLSVAYDRAMQTLRFGVTGPNGATVDLEETSSLSNAVWTPRSSVTLGAAVPALQLPIGAASSRFYRLRVH